ncbi:hypothetical protein FRC01_005224 [Tulasnella sp. 417]|nr:hypothetical protein FRC01_005224 [Tulasnella sp. 417]
MSPRSTGIVDDISTLRPLPAIFTPSRSSTSDPEPLYLSKSVPNAPLALVEDDPGEHNTDIALFSGPPSLHNPYPNSHEQKLPPGKQFPLKLYRMLEDETAKPYVRWIKTKHGDAIFIPDTEAFVTNAMPVYFHEMTQWNSFQKQLGNYGFEKQERGKALYAHSGNKFRQGRPDLLPEVTRRPIGQIRACSRQKRLSTPMVPTAGRAAPEFRNQIYSHIEKDQLEHENNELKVKILELESELEGSQERQSAVEGRLQVVENQLHVTEQRLLEMENRLLELSKKLQGVSAGGAAPDSVVDPGPAQPMRCVDALFNTLNIPETVDGVFSTYYADPLHNVSFVSCPSAQTAYDPVDPLFASIFSAS